MVTSVNSKMTAIADAIRNLLDISGTMGLDAMASNISSITKRGAVAGTISTKSEQYIIPAGYHNGNGTVGIDVAEQAKIIAENIKNGVTILGVSGTASGDTYAVIGVTYPEGSTCTCTDGSKTLKLKDTSGQGFFMIPYAAIWIVTATDGTDTTSETVEITSEGQSASVELSYTLYLYHSGDECVKETGGWGTSLNNGNAYSLALLDGYMQSDSGTNTGWVARQTTKPKNFDGISQLWLRGEVTKADSNNRCALQVNNKSNPSWDNFGEQAQIALGSSKLPVGEFVISLDVSAVNIECYTMVRVITANVKIIDIWCE